MKSKKAIVTLIIAILFSLPVLFYFGLSLGAGNYGYMEQYECDTNKDDFIKIIGTLNTQNVTYQVPKETGLANFADNTNVPSVYYHCYLYYRNENKIIHMVIIEKQNDNSKSILYFDALNDGLILGRWSHINKDFNRSQNLKAKKDFENQVLNKLDLGYQDKGNNMFIFWK